MGWDGVVDWGTGQWGSHEVEKEPGKRVEKERAQLSLCSSSRLCRRMSSPVGVDTLAAKREFGDVAWTISGGRGWPNKSWMEKLGGALMDCVLLRAAWRSCRELLMGEELPGESTLLLCCGFFKASGMAGRKDVGALVDTGSGKKFPGVPVGGGDTGKGSRLGTRGVVCFWRWWCDSDEGNSRMSREVEEAGVEGGDEYDPRARYGT